MEGQKGTYPLIQQQVGRVFRTGSGSDRLALGSSSAAPNSFFSSSFIFILNFLNFFTSLLGSSPSRRSSPPFLFLLKPPLHRRPLSLTLGSFFLWQQPLLPFSPSLHLLSHPTSLFSSPFRFLPLRSVSFVAINGGLCMFDRCVGAICVCVGRRVRGLRLLVGQLIGFMMMGFGWGFGLQRL